MGEETKMCQELITSDEGAHVEMVTLLSQGLQLAGAKALPMWAF